MSAVLPTRNVWWHDALVDWILANPSATKGQMAEHFGKSLPWLSTVTTSDMFKAKLAARRSEMRESLDLELTSKLTRTANIGLDAILDRITRQKDVLPLKSLTDIADKALDRLGYGQQSNAPSPAATVNIAIAVPGTAIAEARERLRAVQAARLQSPETIPEVVESNPHSTPSAGVEPGGARPIEPTFTDVRSERSEQEPALSTAPLDGEIMSPARRYAR